MSAQQFPIDPPFYAEQLGSYKRPDYLLQKRADFAEGKCTQEELVALEDKAIKDIVALQKEVGIKGLTDGEFRRHMFYDGVHENLEGFTYVKPVPEEQLMDYVPDVAAFKKLNFRGADTWICTGKIKRARPFYVDQFTRLASLVSPDEVKNLKITMAAPEWFHLRHGPYAYPKEVYANDAEYLADIAKAYREEFKDLYAIGCRNVQIDDPLLAYFCAESMLQGMKEAGVDSDALLTDYIDCYNLCFQDKPKDMVMSVHLCRGNFKDGRHFSEGGYDRIAGRLFNDLNADVYYLEYDTARAGTFAPLKYLPLNKRCILGVVSSKIPQLEDPAALKKRIEEAAQLLATEGQPPRSYEYALSQLAISPQCGFASHAEGNQVTESDVKAKLELVVNVAKDIWGRV